MYDRTTAEAILLRRMERILANKRLLILQSDNSLQASQ